MPSQQQFVALALATAAEYLTSTNHASVDLQGYINPGGRNMKAILNVGSMLGTTSVSFKMQDNTTSATAGYADITGATWTAVTTTVGAHQSIHFITNKRYVRAVSTFAADSSAVYGIELIAEARNA